jgi:diguanylate cyclase (GGDEF)-like protein
VSGTFHCLDAKRLQAFLERRRAAPGLQPEMSLADNLVEVLKKAAEFVPAEAGSILLDNPVEKLPDRKQNTLTFIAAFGEAAEDLLGQRIPSDRGIGGHVYLTGTAYTAPDVREDTFFYSEIDRGTQYKTRSLIAIPIRIGSEVCGVLELINRRNARDFSEQDRHLLEIFASYISVSIQNVLDGRHALEVAKRDNLTGLYNDRYLHIALAQAIAACLDDGRDLAVLFLDLDYFKRVNDTHGHLAGSQVLREIGRLLRKAMSDTDAIAARYGGDEFVITMPGIGLSAAVATAEQIRKQIVGSVFCAEPGEIQLEPLSLTGITCSIGVATLKRHLQKGMTLEQSKSALLRLSDTAMYIAKETGRNQTAVAGKAVRRTLDPAPEIR